MEKSIYQHCFRREISYSYARRFQRQNHVNRHFIENLQLECILEGHSGCVNCLDWNIDGTLLASGSDDTKVMVWDAYQKKSVQLLNTQHHGNIFSVKFVPCSNDHVIATGAADGHIFLHDLIGKETICAYNVQGRIKRIATTRAEPNVLISSSEDGIVREYDIREHSSLGARVLVDLKQSCGDNIECKCVDINPTNSNCIAVGSNDPYLRLYDRRMFDMHKHGLYFTPGHLRSRNFEFRKRLRNLCVTYLTFNSRGDEVLVNLGGEQIYIFDIYDRIKPLLLETKMKSTTNGVKKQSSNGLKGTEHVPKRCKASPSAGGESSSFQNDYIPDTELSGSDEQKPCRNLLSDKCRLQGNSHFGDKEYSEAVAMYNRALLLSPKSVVYSNRAAAFIKRGWDGDFYAALRDCYSALHVNPSDVKARYRLARCMFELEWFEEASMCITEFKEHHPEHSVSTACVALEKDINVALKQRSNGKKSKKNNEQLSEEEIELRSTCFDYKLRYCGHCNTTTDIKEANFFGDNGQYIVAGSDEGSFFIWERETTNLIRIMKGDSSIVNCVQPHPRSCLLATSGIDSEIKIWSPLLHEDNNELVIEDTNAVAADNQKRMNTNPLESMLLSMGMRFVSSDDENDNASDNNAMPCRPT